MFVGVSSVGVGPVGASLPIRTTPVSFSLSPNTSHTTGAQTITATFVGVDSPSSDPFSEGSAFASISGYSKTGQFTATFSLTLTSLGGSFSISDSTTGTSQSFTAAAVVPGAPSVSATGSSAQATVVITAPGDDGGSSITGYTVVSSPPGAIDQDAGSTLLSHTLIYCYNPHGYTFTATASNAVGTGPASTPSSLVVCVGGAATLTLPDGTTASGWPAYVEIPVINSGSELTDYQILVQLNSTDLPELFASMASDASDIRVTDSSRHVIPYWIDDKTLNIAGGVCNIWARVPVIPASTTSSIRVYFANPDAAVFEIPPLGPFDRSAFTNPLVAVGGVSRLPENIVQDPSDNKYWIVYCTNVANASAICAAWSTDLITWTDGGTIRTTVANSASPQLFYYDDGLGGDKWHLVYSNSGPETSIVIATSPTVNGTYTIQATLVSTGTGWEAARVLEPWLEKVGSTWHLLYMGDAGGTVEQVGHATSTSRFGPFTKDSHNPVLPFGATHEFDSGTVADPGAFHWGGKYWVTYAASTGIARPWNTAIATTTDFVSFRRYGVVLARGNKGAADAGNAHRGVLFQAGDYYYLPLSGHDGTNYTVCLTRQYRKSTANGFPPQQVFGAYDHFDDASLTKDWRRETGSTGGTVTLSSSVMTITSGTGLNNLVMSAQAFGVGWMIESRCRSVTANGTNTRSCEFGLNADDSSDLRRISIYDTNSTHWTKANFSGGLPFAQNMTQLVDTSYHERRVWFADAATTKFQIDNNSWEQLTSQVPDGTLSGYFLAGASASNAATMEVDWVRVRRFATNDPTFDTLFSELDDGADVFVDVSTVSGVGDVGIVSALFDFQQSVTGISGTGSVGTVTAHFDFKYNVTGIAATGNVGSVIARVDTSVLLTGIDSNGQVGDVIAFDILDVAVTGIVGTGIIGDVLSGDIQVIQPTGLQGIGILGDATITVDTSIAVSGVQGAGSVGDVVGSSVISVDATGVQGNGFVGNAEVSSGLVVQISGVSGIGSVGSLIVQYDATISLQGLQGLGLVGDSVVRIRANNSGLPLERTFGITAENRTIDVASENRVFDIRTETRST